MGKTFHCYIEYIENDVIFGIFDDDDNNTIRAEFSYNDFNESDKRFIRPGLLFNWIIDDGNEKIELIRWTDRDKKQWLDDFGIAVSDVVYRIMA